MAIHQIDKKQLIITGGTQGIGKAIINGLDSRKWKVAILARNEARGNRAINELKLKGYSCKFFKIDLSELKQTDCLIKKILKEFNIPYALINNAGTGYPEKIESLNVNTIEYIFRVNLFAPLILIKNVIPIMKSKRRGRIINIASVTGKRAVPFLTTYNASKAGLISITQSIAQEYAEYGVTINSICPACVDTKLAIKGRKMLANLMGVPFKKLYSEMLRKTSINRPILAEEVALVVKLLLSPKSSFITGQSFNICGCYEMS